MNLLQLLLGLVASNLFPSTLPTHLPVSSQETLNCAAAELHEARLLADSNYAAATALMENEWTKVAGNISGKSVAAPPYVLPIVFHIVHENGTENLPDADILRSVDYLNQALSNTGYYDPATGVNTQIQVCLARRTPDNQPTNGINRIVSPLTDLNTNDDRDLKDLTRWEPKDYINVWVVKEACGFGLGCGLAGYAFYPGAHGGRLDGIVMEARWLADDEADVGVLIHELGHYLGLRHTFERGCGNDDCTRDGDRVCDTPPDQSTVAIPCAGSANSCSTDSDSGPFTTDQDDMHINYMDYGYFRCYSAFTAGQRERMHFFLEGQRRSLLESLGCLEPCPAEVTASFTGGDITVPVGTTIDFVNTSIGASDYVWRRSGIFLSADQNYSRTFDNAGTYRIMLVATSPNPDLCPPDSIEQRIIVECVSTASFDQPDTAPTEGETTIFTNSSQNATDARWTVNGTQVSTDNDLSYVFSSSATYRVCLQTGSGRCRKELCRNVFVREVPCELMTVGFTFDNTGFSVGGTLSFINGSTGGTGSSWTIDGMTVGEDRNLDFTFTEVGSFEVCLTERSDVCERSSCQAIVVPAAPCTIVAGFTPQSGDVTVDSLHSFINTSSGGTSFSWTVDGSEVGTERNLEFTFPDIGSFEVCLIERNTNCERRACRNITVIPASCVGPGCDEEPEEERTTPCTPTLATAYINPQGNNSGYVTAILPHNDGFYLGLTNDNKATVMSVDNAGTPLWQAQISQTASSSEITDLMVDNDGMLVGVGFSEVSQACAVRINRFTGDIIWARNYRHSTNIRFFDVSQPQPYGPYVVLGALTTTELERSGGLCTRLDLCTGEIIGEMKVIEASAGIQKLNVNSGAYDPVSGQYFMCGSESSMANILSLSEFGQPIRSTSYSFPPFSNARDIVVDQGELVSLIRGIGLNANEGSINVMKTSFDGTVVWAKSLSVVEDDDLTPTDLVVNDAGYIIRSKVASGGISLIQLNKRGEVLWSKKIVDGLEPSFSFFTDGQKMTMVDGSVAIPGTYPTEEGSLPGFAVVRGDGLFADDCIQELQRTAISEDLANPTGPIRFFESNEIVPEERELAFVAGNLAAAGTGCVEDCPEVSCEETPFSLVFISSNGSSFFSAVELNDEVIFAGGLVDNNAYVGAFQADGEILWQYTFPDNSLSRAVVDLHLDEGGMLAGIIKPLLGNAQEDKFASIFRIDPTTGTMLWHRDYVGILRLNPENINTIPGQTGMYAISGGALLGGNNADNLHSPMVMNINSSDGTVATCTVIQPPLNEGYVDVATIPLTDNRYFIGDNGLGASVALLNPDGNAGWTRSYTFPNESLTIKGQSIANNNDKVVALGNLFPDSGPGEGFVVWQIDAVGNVEWTFRLDLPGDYQASQIVNRGDRYTVYGRENISNEFIMDISYDGELIDYKNHRRSNPPFNDGESVLADDGNLYVAGSFTLSTTRLPSIRRLDNRNRLAEGCFQLISGENVSAQRPTLSVSSSTIASTTLIEVVGNESTFTTDSLLQSITFCPLDCTADEICDNNIDDDEDGLVDCDDPDLATNCCCLNGPTINLGPDTLACPGEVLREGTTRRFAAYLWSNGSRKDSTIIEEAGTYWLMVTDSCGRTASDTLTLHPRSRPQLQLGPDTTLCANAIVPFLAQDGFATYEWTDGTTEKDFTAYEAGTYWVVATDSCGRVQTDTVRVNVDPATVIDLGRDTTICPGDELIFRVDGFSNYQWSQSSFINCFDCPEVRFAPTTDTLLLLAAQQGPGCFSSDSIRVRVAETTGTHDSVSLCPGDSVIFNDLVLFDAGQYYEIQQVSGCERIDTLDVFTLRDTLTSEALTICSGDSALVFGEYKREPFLYRRTYTIENGCDSTHQVELIVNDTSRTAETIGICGGDSILIFGVYEREPGTYSQTFPNTTGCDSTHEVTLEVNEILISTRQIRPDCGGSNPGWGEVLFGSDGTFEVRWSDGSYFKRNERLFADIIYTVTVTEGNGCSVVDSLVVDAAVPPEVQSLVVDESCPGANDGEISILHDRDDLRFRIEQGPYLETSTFRNLADGTYRITIQDGDGCTSRVDLEVEPPEELSLELSETELVVNLGDSVVITPLTEYPLSELRWLIDGVLTCTGCSELVIKPTQSVQITAIAGDNNDCAVTAGALLKVNREDLFYVPNAFSPNGDTLNEEFRVYPGPAVTRILSFEVFDRWGGRVFQRKDYAPEDTLGNWDGLLANGRDPSVGVYVYQVQVELFTGEVISQAGEVLVMR